jgi:hypothetical protein
MAVVRQLRPAAAEPSGDPDRVNVVRLVEFLGPVSPELVLVDPELAARARALLPDTPGPRLPHRERDQPIPLTLAPRPAARRFPWRVATVSALATVAVAFFGLGWATAVATSESDPAFASRPPVAAPAVPAPDPTSPATATTPRAGSTTKPAPTAPRFVWPVEPNADGYRLALFRGNRRVFERDVTEPALQLPSTWTFKGRLESLTQGTYRWAVWPYFGPEKRLGPAIVSAQYAV